MEVCNSLRFLAMFAITGFQNIQSCVSRLFLSNPKPSAWRALMLVLAYVYSFSFPLLSLQLGMIFWLEIVYITGSVLAAGQIPWYMYIFFPWIGMQAFVIIVVLFSKIVYIHMESMILKQHWVLWCTRRGSRFLTFWKIKLKYRE